MNAREMSGKAPARAMDGARSPSAVDDAATSGGRAEAQPRIVGCFEPTPAAALARLHAVTPRDYPDSRNHLRGAVTRLSPYLTHGLLTVPDVIAWLRVQHRVGPRHKLVFELAWREYFREVWRHDGDAIFESLHAGPLPDACYAREVPADVRQACTGLAVIDRAVATLYATGYLHNHARMWFASYLVHLRKVHWRTGADWLYSHLIDGDLASNHLSWQWIAGTGSHRPYLFNAGNVLRYAPPDWQVLDTVLDQSYEAMEAIARDPAAVLAARAESLPGSGHERGCVPHREPAIEAADEPAVSSTPPFPTVPAAAIDLAGRDVWLAHPWSLAEPPPGLEVVAVLDTDMHARWPWNARRWNFVGQRLRALVSAGSASASRADPCLSQATSTGVPVVCADRAEAIAAALRRARSVRGRFDPHLDAAFATLGLDAVPRAFDGPAQRCRSFSTWWSQVRLQPEAAAVPNA